MLKIKITNNYKSQWCYHTFFKFHHFFNFHIFLLIIFHPEVFDKLNIHTYTFAASAILLKIHLNIYETLIFLRSGKCIVLSHFVTDLYDLHWELKPLSLKVKRVYIYCDIGGILWRCMKKLFRRDPSPKKFFVKTAVMIFFCWVEKRKSMWYQCFFH